jgi:hypothetical protein
VTNLSVSRRRRNSIFVGLGFFRFFWSSFIEIGQCQ